jgi:hypothetical protein
MAALTWSNENAEALVVNRQTDNDGRCSTLLEPATKLEPGIYKMKFGTGEYFKASSNPTFYPYVEVGWAGDHLAMNAELMSSYRLLPDNLQLRRPVEPLSYPSPAFTVLVYYLPRLLKISLFMPKLQFCNFVGCSNYDQPVNPRHELLLICRKTRLADIDLGSLGFKLFDM